jgi:hypothetical protein
LAEPSPVPVHPDIINERFRRRLIVHELSFLRATFS